MPNSRIRLDINLCDDIIATIYAADWHAQERGDAGTEESWTQDGERFDYVAADAAQAINAVAGIVHGGPLAEALDKMASIEKKWGDDPQTAKIRAEVARILGWDVTGRDLLAMLRAGEE